ncbi:unnamed protein product [Camellia sinensis]
MIRQVKITEIQKANRLTTNQRGELVLDLGPVALDGGDRLALLQDYSFCSIKEMIRYEPQRASIM